MALFRKIDDVHVILSSKGVMQQVEAFERNGFIYAKKGSGFIGLRSNHGGTTSPTTLWLEIEGLTPEYDDLGRMIIKHQIRRVA